MANQPVVLDETQSTLTPVDAKKNFNLLKLVTSTSVFLALNASIVTAFSSLLYGVEVKPIILAVAFLATFSVYILNKATDKAEDSINRLETASREPLFFMVPSIVASAACLILSASIGAQALAVIATSFIVSVIYSVKLSPTVPRLKEMVGVKSILVALCWGFTGSLLPASQQQVDAVKIALVFAYISIQLLANTVLCDIRDMDGDAATGVKTLPITMGLKVTRRLLLAVNSLMIPWLIYCLTQGLFIEYMPALLFGVGYGYLIIWVFSRKGRSRLLVELAVDGEWIPLVALMKLL